MFFARTCARWACFTAAAATLAIPSFAADKKAASKEPVADTPSYYGPQPATESLDLTMYARIRDEGFKHSHVMEFADALTNGIGPRLTGSPNMKKANEWTRDTLTKVGLENAHLEDWGEFGMGWQQINTTAKMITPDTAPLWMQAAPWSPATNGPVTGEAVFISITDVKDMDKYKGKLKGKIVLFGAIRTTPDLDSPLFHRYTEEELKEMENAAEGRAGAPNIQQLIAERRRLSQVRTAALKIMSDEGVAAIITPSRDGGKGGGAGIIFDDNGANLVTGAQKKDTAVTIPNGVMIVENYNRVARLLEHNVPVTLEVNIETKFTGDNEHGFDTVAEIPGTDPKLKDQVVMVGGHLDSWISGTGATDNAAGSVVAMEAVRILKALGIKPKRTIRIALWSGEEQGLFGSQGYVKQHFGAFAEPEHPDPASTPSFMRTRGKLTTTKEWETLDAYYNLDNGTGKVRGVYTQENYAIAPIFAQWLAPLADLGAKTISYRNTGGTDHLAFDAVGLAGFQYIQDPMDYETRTHHSNMDTFDRLHAADLQQAAVIEAIFLYNTSERDQMMPRKPFPHPELDKQKSAPIDGIYPNATK